MGKNEYIKSARRALKIVDNEAQGHTSYRQLQRVRKIWYEFHEDWVKLNRPESYKVVIIDSDDKENFEFMTHRHNDGRYVVKIDNFSWFD